jgi:hypothetical protein
MVAGIDHLHHQFDAGGADVGGASGCRLALLNAGAVMYSQANAGQQLTCLLPSTWA